MFYLNVKRFATAHVRPAHLTTLVFLIMKRYELVTVFTMQIAYLIINY